MNYVLTKYDTNFEFILNNLMDKIIDDKFVMIYSNIEFINISNKVSLLINIVNYLNNINYHVIYCTNNIKYPDLLITNILNDKKISTIRNLNKKQQVSFFKTISKKVELVYIFDKKTTKMLISENLDNKFKFIIDYDDCEFLQKSILENIVTYDMNIFKKYPNIKLENHKYDIIYKIKNKKNINKSRILYIGDIDNDSYLFQIIDDIIELKKNRKDIELIICYYKIWDKYKFQEKIKNYDFITQNNNLLYKDLIEEIAKSNLGYCENIELDNEFKYFNITTIKKRINNYIHTETINKLNIACIFDKFSYESLLPELNLFYLTPENWKIIMSTNKIDYFFCESTWSGLNEEWKNKICFKPKSKNIILREIIDYCNKKSIKTIFWNKEDPIFYKKAKINFDKNMELFKYKFTSSEKCINKYTLDYKYKVNLLTFGFQPKLFNPMNAFKYNSDYNTVLYTGSWYSYIKNRCYDFDRIFESMEHNNLNLNIYDRFHNEEKNEEENEEKNEEKNGKKNGEKNREKLKNNYNVFPEKYIKNIRKPVNYNQLCELYKKYKLNLVVSSVKDCPTMVSRRVFEVAASGAYLFTNVTLALFEIFKNNIKMINKSEKFIIDKLKIKKNIINNIFLVFNNYRYEHIILKMFQSIGHFYRPKYLEQDIDTIYLVHNKKNYNIIKYLYHYDYIDISTIICIVNDNKYDNFFEIIETEKNLDMTYIYHNSQNNYFLENNILKVYIMPNFESFI